MFRVITNFDDPSSIVEFNNYVDIFHPVRNPPPSAPRPHELKNALQALWNRESILAHPAEFFYWAREHENASELIEKLIASIPDDKLWLLTYFPLLGINEDNKVFYCQQHWRDIQSTGRTQSYFYMHTDYTQDSNYSYRGNNWPAEINGYLDNWYENNFKPLLEGYPTRTIHPDCGLPPVFSSRLAYNYIRLLQNYQIYMNSDGGMYRPNQILPIFTADPTVSLIDLTPNDDYINLQIKQTITKLNKAALFNVLHYSASPLSMLAYPLIAKGEHNPTLYGVELELSTEYSARQLVEATDEPFFIVKSDSSVSGRFANRVELATVPMSFKAHKKQWAYWFSNLDYEKFDTSKDTNNGMHVHIGREAFADAQHVKHFAWFFTQPAHTEFMRFFSQRDKGSFDTYTPIPQAHGSRVRSFNSTEGRCRDVRGCINFSNKGTIEVRLFRGVVSLADIIKNLEFVDSVFQYTSQGKLFTKLSLKDYIDWLHTQPKNKYSIIRKYLEKTARLKHLIEATEILNVIFTEKSPDKIVKLLDKSGLTVTNEHVSMLNRRWKKRIFILKDGKIIQNPGTMSELSFLDRILEQKILHKKDNMAVIVPATAIPPPPIVSRNIRRTVSRPRAR